MATVQFEEGQPGPKTAHPLHSQKQLLNNIVECVAPVPPSALYGEIPKSTHSYEAGYHKISYFALANAVNGIAWWLTKELGPGGIFRRFVTWDEMM